MNPEADRLYHLLPALYRIRDVQEGEPLKALCAVIAEDIAVLRENLDQLYDDQFIETCAEWVAPYIGDLIGYRTLYGVTERTRSARAEVANTIAYRRRKGTASVLEQLARDVTGWKARVVEFFQWLETSQYMNHIRPANAITPNLRDWEPLERRDTAFNTIAHSVDMRRIETQQGRYNIPNIGLFLWRLDAFLLTRSPAFRVDDERYLFSPLGQNAPLFTNPERETEITHLAEPINVPEPISRRVLDRYLGRYYGPQLSLFLEADNLSTAIGNIQVCNLSDDGPGWAHTPVTKISIDPVLGRIAFPPGTPPSNLRVTYHYGFSMPLGGGEYERTATFELSGAVSQVLQGQSLQTALNASQSGGIVEIADSGRYEESLSLNVSPATKLEIRAANAHRPAIVLGGEWTIALGPGAELTLNGLLIVGNRLRVTTFGGSGPRAVRFRHCTLVPGWTLNRDGTPGFPTNHSLAVEATGLTLEIDHCIVGALQTVVDTAVVVTDSVVDAAEPMHVAFSASDGKAAGGTLTVVNSTVFGKIHTARLDLASNTIFAAGLAPIDDWTHPVLSEQNQNGCVRFCFVPLNAVVPRRYRCQPDLAVEQALLAADQPKGSLSPAAQSAITVATQARVRPAFTARRYGLPAYAQLATHCPAEIRTGADDESEMGAFHDVFAPQRERNLRIRLEEYLRFGLEAGIFYAS